MVSNVIILEDLHNVQERNDAHAYINILEAHGINVTVLPSLDGIQSFVNNPLSRFVSVNSSIVAISTYPSMTYFLNPILYGSENVTQVYFAWSPGQWAFAYLEAGIHPFENALCCTSYVN
jgi:hypothetical protein